MIRITEQQAEADEQSAIQLNAQLGSGSPAQRFAVLEQYVECCFTSETDSDTRNRCSIVRGRIELSLNYGDSFSIDDNERDLAVIAGVVGDDVWRRKYLRRLRLVAGLARPTSKK